MLQPSILAEPFPHRTENLHSAAFGVYQSMAGPTASILVIDGNDQLVQHLRGAFGLMRFHWQSADAGEPPIHQLRPTCLIIGPSVPILKAVQICARYRGMESIRNVPIILIGAGGKQDEAIATSAGATDYIRGAASPEQILIRVIVALRKLVTSISVPWHASEHVMQGQEAITFGDLILPENSYSVLVRDRTISLTSAEFQILRKLMKSRGSVVSTDALSRIRVGIEDSTLLSLKSRICSLRRKLRASSVQILTVRNAGYFLSDAK